MQFRRAGRWSAEVNTRGRVVVVHERRCGRRPGPRLADTSGRGCALAAKRLVVLDQRSAKRPDTSSREGNRTSRPDTRVLGLSASPHPGGLPLCSLPQDGPERSMRRWVGKPTLPEYVGRPMDVIARGRSRKDPDVKTGRGRGRKRGTAAGRRARTIALILGQLFPPTSSRPFAAFPASSPSAWTRRCSPRTPRTIRRPTSTR